MATTPTGSGAVSTGTAQGNTPSGNPGAGTHETTSAPTPTAGSGDSGSPAGGAPATGGTAGLTLDDSDFKQDGNLRADAARRISEAAGPRGAARSYNEVTDETVVTTTVDGRTVTFTESGDTRNKE